MAERFIKVSIDELGRFHAEIINMGTNEIVDSMAVIISEYAKDMSRYAIDDYEGDLSDIVESLAESVKKQALFQLK